MEFAWALTLLMRFHFFRNIEQLFHVYGVPSALQAILIRPFLNQKQKAF